MSRQVDNKTKDAQKLHRMAVMSCHLAPELLSNTTPLTHENTSNETKKNTVTITDNRSGKTVEVPISHGTINASDLGPLKIRSFDPGYLNTACCESKITYIDGDKGILRYRGYNIEDLAEHSSFMEVSYLLINGELPTKDQLQFWRSRITAHTFLHENMTQLLKQFRYDAHPMGMLISGIAALSTFYPTANPSLMGSALYDEHDDIRNKQIYRILGKVPTIAACCYRHRIGRPYNYPANHLDYTENFLYMLDKLNETNYKPHPTLVRALDVLFILHADHELNCSTAAMRHLSSSKVDPYTALAGAAGALYGPLHGGACEAVLRMLEDIGTKDNVKQFIVDVKARKKKLMGFGHRVYKSYDPRAKIVKKLAEEVFAVLGKEPLIDLALELEKHALSDDYFVSRKLYPNIDFYTGLIYKAMGFPTDMFPVLFAIPRTAGWLAHWVESLNDKEHARIVRPRQVYLGSGERKYVSEPERHECQTRTMESSVSAMSRRRNISKTMSKKELATKH